MPGLTLENFFSVWGIKVDDKDVAKARASMAVLGKQIDEVAQKSARVGAGIGARVAAAAQKLGIQTQSARLSAAGMYKDQQGKIREQGTGRFATDDQLRSAGFGAGRGFGAGFQRGAQSGIDQVRSGIMTLRSVAFGLGAILATSGLGVGAFFRGVGDFEQTEIAFETLIGDADKAKKTLEDLQRFAAKTPFNFTGLANDSKKLLAYGFAADELIPTMTMLGNIASGVGKEKLPNLILALGQVRSAEKLTGMELRQFTEAGVPLIEELSKTLGKPKSAIQELVHSGRVGYADVQRALAATSAEGGRFHNLMDRQSKSLLGLASNVVDFLQILMIRVGKQGLLRDAKDFMGGLLDWLADNEAAIVRVTSTAIKSLTSFMKSVGAVATAVAYVLKAMATSVGGVDNAVKLLGAGLVLISSARILSGIGNIVSGFVSMARAATIASLGPLAIGAAMASLFLIIEDVVAYFQGRDSVTGYVLKNFDKLEANLTAKATALVEQMKAKAAGLADAIKSWFAENGDKLADAFTAWFEVTKVGVKIGAMIAQGIIDGLLLAAPGIAQTAFPDIAAKFRGEGSDTRSADQDQGLIGLIRSAAQSLFPNAAAIFRGEGPAATLSGPGPLPTGGAAATSAVNGAPSFSIQSPQINVTIPPGMSTEQATAVARDGAYRGIRDALDAEYRQARRAAGGAY